MASREGNLAADNAESHPAATLGPFSADIVRRWPILALAGLSYLLSVPLFEPRVGWMFGYVVFVPWIVAICLGRRSAWVYLTSLAFGFAFWATHWRWLYDVSPPIYFAACVVLALYILPVGCAIRHLYRYRGLSLMIVFPIVWTAGELFRMRGFLGFPMCLLAHSQVRLSTCIQIADLLGALGLTFIVAMVNGWIADLVLQRIARRRAGCCRRQSPQLLVCSLIMLLAVAATLVYGRVRLAYDGATVGPRVAVVQGDFPIRFGAKVSAATSRPAPPADDEIDRLYRIRGQERTADARLTYLHLVRDAARARPDLIVLPEDVWSAVLNREFRESPLGNPDRILLMQLQHEQLARLADRYRTSLVIGASSVELRPPGDFPSETLYNSAFLYMPGVPEPARYDKISLVLFGEYLPFRDSDRFFRVYRLLNDGFWNPWGRGGNEYVVTPGKDYTTFSLPTRTPGARKFRFATAICYEDVLPQQYRRFVVGPDGRKRVDFMLTLSNARWFGQGNQQAQHLVDCAFRAVENRVWIARASDGGISGFINPDGRWHDLVGCPDGRLRPGGSGYRIAESRIDPRVTVYSRYGDWFAWTCVVMTAAALVDALGSRIRRTQPQAGGLVRKADNGSEAR